jgi:S-DNA-T family DNA segregation ATPase FtsK/SpoIIIE
MSKKKESDKKTKEKGASGVENFFMDERLRFISGAIITGLAFYLLISCLSFLLTWQTDHSVTALQGLDAKVDNWGGRWGHIISEKIISYGFGFGAFLIPFIFGAIGLKLLNFPKIRVWGIVIKLAFAVLVLSIVLSFMFGLSDGYLISGPGGAHGLKVTRWLNALIGKIGTLIFIVIIVIGYIVFAFKVSPSSLRPKRITFPKKEKSDNESMDPEEVAEKSAQDLLDKEGEESLFNAWNTKKAATDSGKIVNDMASGDLYPGKEEIDMDKSDQIGADNTNNIEIIRPEEDDILSDAEVDKMISDYDPRLDLSNYKFPPISILKDYKSDRAFDDAEVLENKDKIIKTLDDFKIGIKNITATVGPTVTLYEIVPDRGVKLARIKSLEDDIALNLSALGIRIIAPIPGRGTVGIEVPNKNPKIVAMRSLVSSKSFQETKFDIPLALGRTITNEPFVADLAKMPHLLVAGATGQGKSVGINAIIASILYKKHPAEVKFVLIDPKRVELPLYSKIERHFLAKLPGEDDAIITDTQKVINTLNSLCIEMDQRLELLKAAQSRNIKEYNEKFTSRRLNPEKGHKYLPYIVLIIDEFADLIMTAGREIEGPIGRLAQLARAIGIHLIISTQRPSTNIITGFIKANFPTRIAFRVFSSIDSRTILDSTGAERLVGRGDMLISSGNEPIRLQCAFIDTPEIEELTEYIGSQQGYTDAFMLPDYVDDSNNSGLTEVDLKKRDPLFEEAARLVVSHQQGSTSLIQRKLQIGYNRAGRIIDQLEAAGIVGPFEGSKAREVFYSDLSNLEQILSNL